MNLSTNNVRHAAGQPGRSSRRLFRVSALAAAIAFAGMTAYAGIGPGLPAAHSGDSGHSMVQIHPPGSFAPLVESVQPAVVNISVSASMNLSSGTDGPDFAPSDDPRFREFFEHFFQNSPSRPGGHGMTPKVEGAGSGFIVSPDGYVVTSNHVIANASEIHVVLNDGRRLPARVKGRDPKTDLALLKVESGDEFPYVTFGSSDDARPGDWVVAIGNPFGFGGTVTTGIISARGRDIQSGPYDDYLQIDAPINRGNSGGPLFDTSGKVIGVNTAIYSPTGGNVGIGFAIPATQAKVVIEQLKQKGLVERGWLGVQIQALDDDLVSSIGLSGTRGALVALVTPDSPAAKAGIRVGDVILSFNDHEVTELKDLPRLVADVPPGEKSTVTVWRHGQEKRLDVAVASMPELSAADSGGVVESAAKGKLGLRLSPVTDELRDRLDIAQDVKGALVVDVESGSPAAQKGIRRGDIIVQAGGSSVSAPEDVIGAVGRLNSSDSKSLLLLINRHGDQYFVSVQPS